LLRMRTLVYLSVFFVLVLGYVSYLGILQTRQQQEQQRIVQEHLREQWEALDQMNTHSAAHFGTFALKPPTFLSSIDDGINSITGSIIRLEAHVQNENSHSDASQSLAISKFGNLKPSLLLQYVIPLFLICLAFSSMSSEKETKRLKLLVFQNASVRKLVFAKTFSLWFYGLLLLVITAGANMLMNLNDVNSDIAMRMFNLLFVYALYYYIVTLLSTWLSAFLKNKTASLSSMLALWILWTIFLPKIWGNTAEQMFALPSRQEFKTAMSEDRSKGIDAHNPTDKRTRELEAQTLAKYGVEKLEDLPFNYDGVRMQADEDYGNIVWDKHFGRNNEILHKQKTFYQLSGIFNPFASLQSASMGYCGSDMYHYADFQRQAENYRREFIKKLNDQQTFGGSKLGDWTSKEDNAFFRTIEDFQYLPMTVDEANLQVRIDVLSLFSWCCLLTIVALFTAKKMKIA